MFRLSLHLKRRIHLNPLSYCLSNHLISRKSQSRSYVSNSRSSKLFASSTHAEPFKLDEDLGYQSKAFQSGFISILGNPNVGKSTLMNAFLNYSLSIVSPKPQTTRHRIFGIVTEKDYQLVFSDTPGMLNFTAYKLHDEMMGAVGTASGDADVILLVTDIFGEPLHNDKIMNRINSSSLPVIVAINKIDLMKNMSSIIVPGTDDFADFIPSESESQNSQIRVNSSHNFSRRRIVLNRSLKSKLNISTSNLLTTSSSSIERSADHRPHYNETELEYALFRQSMVKRPILKKSHLIGLWKSRIPRAEIVFLAANISYNVNLLKNSLLRYIPMGPKYYEDDQLTTRDERFFSSEIIREAIIRVYKNEIPYSCHVDIISFEDINEKYSRIEADILVARKSQKAIVIGKGAEKIKETTIIARENLKKFLGRNVFLKLNAVVREDWRSNDDMLVSFGYKETLK